MNSNNHTSAGFNIRKFIHQESFGGFLLIGVTIIAVVWANSSYYDAYNHIWHNVKMGFSFGGFELKGDLHHWVNDGLMAIFFFVIGLEIKREVMDGGLSSFQDAILPITGAIGCMLVPALIYAAFSDEQHIQIAKVGVFAASILAAILGMIMLSYPSKQKK